MFQLIDKKTNRGVKIYGVKMFYDDTKFLIYRRLGNGGLWVWDNAENYRPLDCDINEKELDK